MFFTEKIKTMTITFDIHDVTSLTSKKDISINVSGIQASGDEMHLAAHLTSKIKEIVLEYVDSKEDNGKKKG